MQYHSHTQFKLSRLLLGMCMALFLSACAVDIPVAAQPQTHNQGQSQSKSQGNSQYPSQTIDQQSSGSIDSTHLFKQAQSLENREQYNLALAMYQNLIADKATPAALRARSQCRQAVILAIQGKMEKVFAICTQLSTNIDQTARQDPELMIDLDDLTDYMLAHEKDDKDGREALYCSLRLRTAISPDHPHIAESYLHLSRYYTEHKDYKEAIKCTQEAIKSQQHLPKALALLDRCACGNWMKSSLHYSLGQVLNGQNRLEEADAEYRQGIADYNKYPDKSINIAACCERALKLHEECRSKKHKLITPPKKSSTGAVLTKVSFSHQ
jgi:tetratricopeptide (TPR) repeat protein